MLTTLEKIYLSLFIILCFCFFFIGFYCTLFCQFLIYSIYCVIYHFILKDLEHVTFIRKTKTESIYITKHEWKLIISLMIYCFIFGDVIFFIYDNFPFVSVFIFFRF